MHLKFTTNHSGFGGEGRGSKDTHNRGKTIPYSLERRWWELALAGKTIDGNWEGDRTVAAATQTGYQWRAETLDGRTLLDKIM